ncbi:DUF2752 domain-containing protein [Actinomadura sp. KC06]|uniref:DUF2752 domain-containing protein n=1 Tax=Actinomadura sp. KC06 TaxID=2530369 RepID=UPI001FB5FFAB|nr:DUF2752 domain-containing protein [Actinomadura sp. KC06]
MAPGRRAAPPGPGGRPSGHQGEPRDRAAVAGALRLLRPGAVLAAAVAAVSYVAAVDPNEDGHYPTCPFLSVTGLQCPGCGSMRTVHALAHGRIDDAVGLNVLAVAAIPLMAFFWLRWARARALDRPVRTKASHPALIWALFGTIMLFWLVRNLPFGSFLAA